MGDVEIDTLKTVKLCDVRRVESNWRNGELCSVGIDTEHGGLTMGVEVFREIIDAIRKMGVEV